MFKHFLRRCWLALTKPFAKPIALEKRRLQRIAQDEGCTRKQAQRIVAAYFK